MLKIEKIIPGGFGLSTDKDGRKAFLWNALPGENVLDYEITKKKSHYFEAVAKTIENNSKHRVSPKDNIFLSTSPWQIMTYEYELQTKQELVVELFREHNISIEKPEIFTDHKDYFYRNKMEYSLYWDIEEEKIKPAFRMRGSHRKIPINTSSIERPEIFAAAQKIIDDLNSRGEEARKYQSLLLRCDKDGKISGGLYENHKPHPIFPPLTDQILGHSYSYSPNGFFQINLPVYEMALKEIRKHIKTDKVLDLYAGVGTIGLSVARDKDLILVEVDKSAYQELQKNCKQASLNLADAILARSEDVLNYINPDQTVIIDPPRAGCDRKLIDHLNKTKPKVVIYLSCNPATQARDVKILLNSYKITNIKTFNFFPRTPHIENLVILELI